MRGTGAAAILLALAACGEPARGGDASATAALPAAAPSVAGRASSYSSLAEAACKTIETNEETGDWVGTCPGAGGYGLEYSVSDLRDELKLIDGKKRTPLGIPDIVAKGAFAALGDKVEWRGPAGGRPDSLIVRVHIGDSEAKEKRGSLAVARLGATPCLIAVVEPGAGQNERARAVSDGPQGNCLKAD